MGLTDPPGQVTGSIRFDGQELVGARPRDLRGLRARRIAMVFQDPMTALNPYRRIGDQLGYIIDQHRLASGSEKKRRIIEMLERTGLPIGQLVPSHVNQTDAYMADAIEWGRRGGWVDVGANYGPENNFHRATPPARAVSQLLEAGVPLSQILLSSDGNGAPPKEEKQEGRPASANYMPVGALHAVWRRLIVDEGLTPSDALQLVTTNVAAATGLRSKGSIAPGMDADLNVFDADWQLQMVIARGEIMVENGTPVHRGMYDQIILSNLS